MHRLMIIDDFFGRQLPRGRNLERESLCRRLGLVEFTGNGQSAHKRTGVIGQASFFRGQRPEMAVVGDIVKNDLEECLRRVETGTPDGAPWDMLILDLCFYTGEVTPESNAQFAGLPEGRPEDDDPECFFGLEILAAVRSRFPALPVVVFSAHDSKAIQSRVRAHGALRFIPRDDAGARQLLEETLGKIPAELVVGALPGSAAELLRLAQKLSAPTTEELRGMMPVLKELEAVLLQRALHGAFARHQNGREGIGLLPAIKLITGNENLTTSQAADLVKRLVHQTRPYDGLLLADGMIQEAYERSVRLRPR